MSYGYQGYVGEPVDTGIIFEESLDDVHAGKRPFYVMDPVFIGSLQNPGDGNGGNRLVVEHYFAAADKLFFTLQVYNEKGTTTIRVRLGCPQHIINTYKHMQNGDVYDQD
jgi:hypothetical protein